METDLVFVIHHHLQKTPSLGSFAFQIGVEKYFITFATTPQDIVLATELPGSVQT